MRYMKKLISLAVAVVMVLVLLLPVSATEYETITCGEAFTVEGLDGKTYYQFVAETDGWYCIWTEGAEDADNNYHVTLLDANMDWLEYDYRNGIGGGIEFFWELNAGAQYYLEVINYDTDHPPYSLCVDEAGSAQALAVIPDQVSGYPGNGIQFEARFLPYPALPENVTWSSSDETIVSIESWGYGNMKRPGTATVTATSESGFTAQCAVTVLEPPPISCGEQVTMDLTADIPLMFVPQEDGYYAITFTDGPEKMGGYLRNDTYEEVAYTKDEAPFSMAPYLKAGERYYIEVLVSADEQTTCCTVSVEQTTAPTAITPLKERITEYVGCSGILKARSFPLNTGEEKYTWSTEDTDIIDLYHGGSYETLTTGTATVTVTSDSGLTATVIIDVIEPPEGTVDYGECGDDMLWHKSADGTLTVIGTGLLWGESFCCDDITSVILPQGLTWIGRDAFLGCENLTQITIPQTVKRVDEGAFFGCDNLKHIYFEGDAPELCEDLFYEVTATAYYLSDSRGWTADVCGSYGGDITWKTWDAVSGTISCSVTTSDALPGDVTLALLRDGEVVYTGTDRLYNVSPGSYTMTVSRYGHVTREIAVNVGSDAMSQAVEICPIGDVTGDGEVNIADVGRVYSNIKGSTEITDDYALECANVNGDSLDIGDVGMIYAHVKGTKRLF